MCVLGRQHWCTEKAGWCSRRGGCCSCCRRERKTRYNRCRKFGQRASYHSRKRKTRRNWFRKIGQRASYCCCCCRESKWGTFDLVKLYISFNDTHSTVCCYTIGKSLRNFCVDSTSLYHEAVNNTLHVLAYFFIWYIFWLGAPYPLTECRSQIQRRGHRHRIPIRDEWCS